MVVYKEIVCVIGVLGFIGLWFVMWLLECGYFVCVIVCDFGIYFINLLIFFESMLISNL